MSGASRQTRLEKNTTEFLEVKNCPFTLALNYKTRSETGVSAAFGFQVVLRRLCEIGNYERCCSNSIARGTRRDFPAACTLPLRVRPACFLTIMFARPRKQVFRASLGTGNFCEVEVGRARAWAKNGLLALNRNASNGFINCEQVSTRLGFVASVALCVNKRLRLLGFQETREQKIISSNSDYTVPICSQSHQPQRYVPVP